MEAVSAAGDCLPSAAFRPPFVDVRLIIPSVRDLLPFGACFYEDYLPFCMSFDVSLLRSIPSFLYDMISLFTLLVRRGRI
jgi:hypothetical protein